MTILGIILMVIGTISFILGGILGVHVCNNNFCVFLLSLVFLIPIGVGLIAYDKNSEPTEQDVLDGKAYYQETQVITDNDTIKTYEIVWKQKN